MDGPAISLVLLTTRNRFCPCASVFFSPRAANSSACPAGAIMRRSLGRKQKHRGREDPPIVSPALPDAHPSGRPASEPAKADPAQPRASRIRAALFVVVFLLGT